MAFFFSQDFPRTFHSWLSIRTELYSAGLVAKYLEIRCIYINVGTEEVFSVDTNAHTHTRTHRRGQSTSELIVSGIVGSCHHRVLSGLTGSNYWATAGLIWAAIGAGFFSPESMTKKYILIRRKICIYIYSGNLKAFASGDVIRPERAVTPAFFSSLLNRSPVGLCRMWDVITRNLNEFYNERH